MSDTNNELYKNPFFTRGCCGVPGTSDEQVYKPSCCKLSVYDWLKNIEQPGNRQNYEYIEVRFKNSKKDFFRALAGMNLIEGDIVAVEASPGHDIGIVSLAGEAVKLQMKKKNQQMEDELIKKVYRRARLTDIEKWVASVENEDKTLFKSRELAGNLGLEMKFNDIEYQGDGTKAVFYYTAEDRVDFRELIKVLAENFKVRIEMRQIGARQEAARLGGIGSCGRELCCSTWLTNFSSVTTNNARIQQLSLNPSKLAGQCGKLKCCLNYENEMYVEALKEFPSINTILKTKKGEAEYQKSDVFKRIMWFSYVNDHASMMAIPLDSVKEIIKLNEKGKMPADLEKYAETMEQKAEFSNGHDEQELIRFDEEFI
ncbi:MAG: regulatory iron-sulfur-containing complex subunit RicT [Bacteroidales bacterium]